MDDSVTFSMNNGSQLVLAKAYLILRTIKNNHKSVLSLGRNVTLS